MPSWAPALGVVVAREDPSEEAAAERAPREQTEAVVLAGGDDLELDRPRRQVVEVLLGHEAEEVPCTPAAGTATPLPRRLTAPARVISGALTALHQPETGLPLTAFVLTSIHVSPTTTRAVKVFVHKCLEIAEGLRVAQTAWVAVEQAVDVAGDLPHSVRDRGNVQR